MDKRYEWSEIHSLAVAAAVVVVVVLFRKLIDPNGFHYLRTDGRDRDRVVGVWWKWLGVLS